MKPKVFIDLNHTVQPFCFPQRLVDELAALFPQFEYEAFQSTREMVRRIHEPSIIMAWHFDRLWYARATALHTILTPAAGKDWIAPDPSGKVRTIHGSFQGPLMAESLLAMLLYFSRRFHQTLANQRARLWHRTEQDETRRLSNQNVLIVGYGAIGRAIAARLMTFGCAMRGLRRSASGYTDPATGVAVIAADELMDSLAWADHTIAVLPADGSTDGFFTIDHFNRMKRSGYFYNLGRGNCCATDLLVTALRERLVAGAGLDVFMDEPLPASCELWGMENVLITPHSAAIFSEYMSSWLEELKTIFPGLPQTTSDCANP